MNPHKPSNDFPYWLAALVILAIAMIFVIINFEIYNLIFARVAKGIGITLYVTAVAFALSCALGLLLAVGMNSSWALIRQTCRFYVEIVRGIPMLVLLFYFAFVGTPMLIDIGNFIFTYPQQWGWLDKFLIRDFDMIWRAIFALMIGYSAYIAEVFRAGFQSVDRGQYEAANALGLSRFTRFYKITMPQAFKVILPPLGNDFIAMIKDSALVSVLGVADITQMGKLYAAGTFRFFETYNIVTFIYLVMTISLSLALRGVEAHMDKNTRLQTNQH
ncbi:MAG: amino acid ABC transporter permease [Rhizobiales bacterium]|nr:amino acid ABC transporter permease [Hyphomicrobiales bacterium]NRB13623.1 amino acid ABC transporter permease [Hyphomicrobiales bacterium]